MAAHTEGHQIIFQKMISFGRSMRIVATDTSFLHRTVLKLCFGHSIANILMAIKTELIACLKENKLIT